MGSDFVDRAKLPQECLWHTHSIFRRCAYGLSSYDYLWLTGQEKGTTK